MNEITSIRTTYNGMEYRSRLEAKYAAFFDLCGWKHSYEPMDFNGWIPDFAIGELPTLVEIKPFFHERDWDDAISKIIESGCIEPVILFGADVTFDVYFRLDAPPIALLLDGKPNDLNGEREVHQLHFGFTEGNGKFGLCPLDAGWKNWIWQIPPPGKRGRWESHPNKWGRVDLPEFDRNRTLVAFWAEACNRSQWMPRNELRPQVLTADGVSGFDAKIDLAKS